MKRIQITLLVVLSIVVLAFPQGNVKADFICDDYCLQAAINGELSPDEIKSYGVGNLVKTVTNYFKGDVWMALKKLNLASNTYIADTTVNVIYSTNLDGSILGLYQCQEGYAYCSKGQILGYYQVEATVFRVKCDLGGSCKTEVLLENQPADLLEQVFNQSHYYGGPGEWE